MNEECAHFTNVICIEDGDKNCAECIVKWCKENDIEYIDNGEI